MPINEYDALAQKLKEQQPENNEYDVLARQLKNAHTFGLRTSLEKAETTTPARAAEVINLSERTRLPADFVDRNFDDINKQSNVNEYATMLEQSPALVEFLKQEENSALAREDLKQLGALEWMLTAPGKALGQGQAIVDSAKLSAESIFRPLTGDENKHLKQLIEASRFGGDLGSKTWFGEALVGGAQTLPMMYAGVKEAGKYGVPTALAFGTLAALTYKPATLEATKLGLEVGSVFGASKYGFELNAGIAMQEFSEIKDELGQPIDPDIVRAAALVAGALNAPLEVFGLGAIARSFPGAGQLGAAATRDFVREKLQSPTVRDALKNLMVGYGRVLSIEVGTEVAQRGVEILTADVAKAVSGQKFKPEDRGQQLIDELSGAATSFAYISAIGPGAKLAVDARRIRTARRNEAYLKSLGDQVKEVKNVQKVPQKLSEFVAKVTNGAENENVYIDIAPFVEYWQGKADPMEIAKEWTGSETAYSEAVSTGGVLTVPMAKYVTNIAGTEHNAFFATETRLSPDALNAREAAELEKELATEQEQESKSAGVREDIIGQLINSGVDRRSVEDYAKWYESAFRSLGERAERDPMSLFRPYELTVTRPLPDVLTQKKSIDDMDVMLDRLRSGDVPSQQEIYGKSLTEWLRDSGGIQDQGGEISAMDADADLKPFQKKLIKETGSPLDMAREAAVESGYLNPDATINDFIDAIANDLAGRPVYAKAAEDVLGQLDDYLRRIDVDLQTMSNAEVKALLNKALREPDELERTLYQSVFHGTSYIWPPEPGFPHGRPRLDRIALMERNGEALDAIREIAQGGRIDQTDTKAFRDWFKDSVVTDTGKPMSEGGTPLAVYHGSLEQGITEFDPGREEPGVWFTRSLKYANDYAKGPDGEIYKVYLATEHPLVVDFDGNGKPVVDGAALDIDNNVDIVEYAQRKGYDGVHFPYGNLSEDSETWVVFYPEQIKSAIGNRGTFDPNNPSILAQDGMGRMLIGKDGKIKIELFEGADLSTFIHESGHFFLEVFGDVVDQLRAKETLTESQDNLVEDYGKLLKWLGVTKRSEIGEAQHEQWARGIEAYLRRGKAPSIELQSVFARFGAWLKLLYKSLKDLKVKLSDEVIGVMDRLFATDQEIEAAAKESEIVQMFLTAESASMEQAEFDAYTKTIQDSVANSKAELQAKLMQEFSREQTAAWREAKKKIREEVAAEVNGQKVYIALKAIQKGVLPDGSEVDIKLDRDVIIAARGEEFAKTLPKGTTKKGGTHPDAVAQLFGYSSGDELIFALVNARPATALIEAETAVRMRETYGDMMTDGSIADAAITAVNNRGEVLLMELKALRRKQREVAPFVSAERGKQKQKVREGLDKIRGIPTLDVFTRIARGRIAQTLVRNMQPTQHLAAARRAAKAAVEAATKQDFDAAALEKQKQILNLELYRLSKEAVETEKEIVKYVKSFDDKKKRMRIGKAGGGFLEHIDALRAQFSFIRTTLKDLDKINRFESWVAEQQSLGIPVELPEELLNRRLNYKEVPYEMLLALRDAIQHLEHMARFKNRLLKSKARKELDAAAAEMSESIYAHAKKISSRTTGLRSPTEDAKRAIWGAFASHDKLSYLMRLLDGFENGVMWQYVQRTLNGAADEQTEMTAALKKTLEPIFGLYSGMEKVGLHEKLYIPAISDSLSKMERLMVAIFWGHKEGRYRIRDGHNWDDAQVQAILDTLDEKDWRFVTAMWKAMDAYWPLIEAKEKRVKGIAPKRVEAVAVTTRFGTFEGGYSPIYYEDRAAAPVVTVDMSLAKAASLAAFVPSSGFAKERQERVMGKPVRLDFGLLFEHFTEVIHSLSHHEALLDVARILDHKDIQKAIYDTAGDIVYKEIKASIIAIARGDIPQVTGFDSVMLWLRQGTTIAVLGYKLTTGIMQLLGVLPTMASTSIGRQWVARGARSWMGDFNHIEAKAQWVYDNSSFMKNRHLNLTYGINEIRDRVGVNTGVIAGWAEEALKTVGSRYDRQQIADSFFWFITTFQRVPDFIIWVGAYEKAMAAEQNESKAFDIADQEVRNTQGSGQMVDLSSIQIGNVWLKLFTNFYNYMNVVFNQNREVFRKTNFKEPESIGRLFVDLLYINWLPATLAWLIRGGPDDDEEWAEDLARENLSFAFGQMIGLREMSSFASGYYGYEGPAGVRFFSKAGKAVQQAGQGELDLAFWKSINSAAGIALHYPAEASNNFVEGIIALEEGETENPLVLIRGTK